MDDDILRRAVLERLAFLDQVAKEGDTTSLLMLARNEILRLSEGWRALLDAHRPDEDGRCRSCTGSLRRRRWPCDLWLTAHQHLIGETPSHRARHGRSRGPLAVFRTLRTDRTRTPDRSTARPDSSSTRFSVLQTPSRIPADPEHPPADTSASAVPDESEDDLGATRVTPSDPYRATVLPPWQRVNDRTHRRSNRSTR